MLRADDVTLTLRTLFSVVPFSELRRHLRSRGQTPAGGRQALQERLTEYLVQARISRIQGRLLNGTPQPASGCALSLSVVIWPLLAWSRA